MIALEPINSQNAMVFKAIRLSALQDSPAAFGSTYAKESRLSDFEWVERAARLASERSAGFLAMDAGGPCGIVGAFVDDRDSSRAHLVSMWTAPKCRRLGVGRSLVDAVLAWSRHRGVSILQLMVTCNNESAIKFYQNLGFAFTGKAEPYPNDLKLIEFEMSRPV